MWKKLQVEITGKNEVFPTKVHKTFDKVFYTLKLKFNEKLCKRELCENDHTNSHLNCKKEIKKVWEYTSPIGFLVLRGVEIFMEKDETISPPIP